MDLLSKTYSDDEEEPTTEAAVISKKPRLDLAPDVTLDVTLSLLTFLILNGGRRIHNMPHL